MEKLFHIELQGLEWQSRCLRCCRTERNSFLPDIVKSSQQHSTLEHDDEPLVCELFVRGKELATLALAPEGFIWKWEDPQEAHLVSLIDSHALGQGICGQPAWGIHLAYLIGGYSARPCEQCLEKEGGSASNGGANS